MTAPAIAADPRRITEQDPDFARVKARWERRLLASVRQLQRDIAAGGEQGIEAAQSAFIHRHLQLLREAYVAGHTEGQRDYWDEVSLHPAKWAREKRVAPRERVIQQRLMFYGAASVVKLAREAAQVYKNSYTKRRTQADRHDRTGATAAHTTTPHAAVTLADPPPDLAFDKFTAWASPRIGLQADLTWSGFQDGYLDAASADAVGLKLQLWWELGEVKTEHCGDCPAIAANSPYDAPGSGGNQLQATPGDGSTACGASCKCNLRYGYTQLAGLGLLPAQMRQVFELPAPSGAPPLAATGPSEWEQQRQAAIDQAVAQSQQPGQHAPSTQPLEPGAPSIWEQRRAQSIRQAQGIVPWEQRLADQVRRATPLSWLNEEQRQALDDIRGIELLWDVVRGSSLPAFEVYFDPESRNNLWLNPSLDGLDTAQRELVARYFRALGDFQDASPLTGDEPPATDAGGGAEQGGGGARLQ